MIHLLVTLAAAILFWPLNWQVESAILATAFYCGREHAQAEQRVISKYYGNKRANSPWWSGFEQRAWTAKGMLDWALPLLVLVITILISTAGV